MKTFNGLPLYTDNITDENCGMLRISLVDIPAVESDFQHFAKAERVMFSDEERRLILGVVMRADYPILRIEGESQYYVMFTRETIREMAEKYLAENRQNRINLMHNGEEIRGVQMVQMFIKDSAKGIVPKGYENIEDGSLFAEFKIHNEEVWAWIKEGVLRGFSLEGLFDMRETFNKSNMKKNWKKVLARIVSKFTEITTDKGILTFDGELEIGKDVYLLTSEGEVVDAEDGTYKTEDGRSVEVSDGRVASIEVIEEAAEDEEKIADEVDIHNLAAEVERLKGELASKDEAIKKLEERLSALEQKADKTEEAMKKITAQPAHEEIKRKEEMGKLGSSHEDFLKRLNNA